MVLQTQLAEHLDSADFIHKADESCKKLISHKIILAWISTLFSTELKPPEKKCILQEVFELPMTQKFEEDIETMCNYGTGIAEAYSQKGLQRGIEQGIKQGIERGIEQGNEQGTFITLSALMKDGILSLDEAAKRMNVSVTDFQEMLQEIH